VDGQRTFPEDQEPRWPEGEPRYGEPPRRETYRDDTYRVPEPRGGQTPSFNGFTERSSAGDTGEHSWGAPPTYPDPPQEPSWRSHEPTLLPTARPQHAPPPPHMPPPQQPLPPPPPPSLDPLEGMQPISGDPIRPVSGEPLEAPTGVMPPVTPREEQRYHAEAIDRSALRRAGPQQQTVAAGDGVYRTKRPAVALLFAILTVIFELGAVRVLLDGMFGGPFLAGQTIAGMFLIAGLPVFALGLYGASGGGVRAEVGGWAKPPVLYLVAGLGLLIAASIAA
jgi:hypothetical protein